MPLHAVTSAHIPSGQSCHRVTLHAVTCRYVPLRAPIRDPAVTNICDAMAVSTGLSRVAVTVCSFSSVSPPVRTLVSCTRTIGIWLAWGEWSHENRTAITQQSHSNHTASTPQAHCKHTAITQQSHSKHTASTPQAHRKHTASTPQAHCKHTASTQQAHRKHTASTAQAHSKHTASTQQAPRRGRCGARAWRSPKESSREKEIQGGRLTRRRILRASRGPAKGGFNVTAHG